MSIFDDLIGLMIFEELLNSGNKKTNTSSKENKKVHKIEPPIVTIGYGIMNIIFDEADIERINELTDSLESHPCEFEQDEFVFRVEANPDTLYKILVELTSWYDGIKVL